MKPQQFGPIEVHKLVELDPLPFESKLVFRNMTPEVLAENREWLGPHLVEPGSDRLYLSFHSYVIRTPHLNIMLDTCNGNHKNRPSMTAFHMLNKPYLERLAAIGLRPEDIDVVFCTHLHVDHVGWNTRLENGRWVPTFPNARYLFSRGDFDYFHELFKTDPDVVRGSFADSVMPIVEAGRATMIDADHVIDAELADNIHLESAPGHSPGSLNLFLKGGGRRACFCGDVFHHALQCAAPWLQNGSNTNDTDAEASRRSLFERYADTDMLMMTGHFPDPSVGRILSHPTNFRFRFEE